MGIISPTNYLSGNYVFDSDSGVMNIPIGRFPGLSNEEADPYSGDFRKILYEFIKDTADTIDRMDPANKPTRFSVVRNTPIGISTTSVRQSFTVSFDLDITSADVALEA